MTFLEELKQQRWDDHRFYHQSRINQSLHFISAMSFVIAYALLSVNPAVSAMLGWVVSMCTRQAGHFFFEPKSYDKVNDVTNDYKERIKVGYNIKRKIVLMLLWALSPIALYYDPDLMGLIDARSGFQGYMHNLMMVWLFLGGTALLFRVIQLFFIASIQTGLVWGTKILTDPFNDILLYHKAPIYLLRGEKLDPMVHVRS
jgi:hypothetical protein